jgi:competence protein ComEC
MVISVGVDNRFGHPHHETIVSAERLGIDVRRTDLHGSVLIKGEK